MTDDDGGNDDDDDDDNYNCYDTPFYLLEGKENTG